MSLKREKKLQILRSQYSVLTEKAKIKLNFLYDKTMVDKMLTGCSY